MATSNLYTRKYLANGK